MDRHEKILELILKNHTPVSVDYIAEQLKVSNKTIRNDFAKLESIVSDADLRLSKKPGVGITIEGPEGKKLELINKVKDSSKYVEPYSPEDRLNHILKVLFMSKTSTTSRELSESLYVSRVTLQKDLDRVEEWLAKFNLSLLKKPNHGIEVIGSEEDWRKAAAFLLVSNKGYTELKELFYEDYEGKIDHKSISKLKDLVNIDYSVLEKIVNKAEDKLQFKFSDEAFISLIMHIAIAIKRLEEKKDVKLSEEILNSLRENEEYEIAKQIAADIECSFKVNLPEAEVGYILLHILGTKILEGKSCDIKVSLEEQSENELAVIMAKEIISVAQRALNINLSCDKQLMNGLILHLRPTINRLKYGLTLRNTILKEIKENYMDIFGAACMTNTIFEKYVGVTMPEEEIGFICLHLAAAAERNKKPIMAIVVCASGIGTSQIISARIERSFKEIEIVDVISTIELKSRKLDDIDIVISTVPMESEKPVLMISPLLSQNDIRRLDLYIENLRSGNMDKNTIHEFIDKSMIFIREEQFSKEALLREMCYGLVEKGYVEKEFIGSVLDREKVYSTALDWGISLPHGDPRYVKASCLAISILKRPIPWGNEKTDIVFLLCISPDNIRKSSKWVRALYNFIECKENRALLKSSKDSEEVYRIMEEFIYVD
jgi:transcriptional antiterminator